MSDSIKKIKVPLVALNVDPNAVTHLKVSKGQEPGFAFPQLILVREMKQKWVSKICEDIRDRPISAVPNCNRETILDLHFCSQTSYFNEWYNPKKSNWEYVIEYDKSNHVGTLVHALYIDESDYELRKKKLQSMELRIILQIDALTGDKIRENSENMKMSGEHDTSEMRTIFNGN